MIRWLCIISGALLLLAIPTFWPYNYYIFLRSAIFSSSILVAYRLYKSGLINETFIFVVVAFLFNPIASVYLNKQTWVYIDFISAILFFAMAYYVKKITELKLEKSKKITYGFAGTGYILGLIFGYSIWSGLIGAFIGGWVAVFYITYVLKE